jgi:histidyl-tRNA synthetase
MGIERLLLVLEALDIEPPNKKQCDVFIATHGKAATLRAQSIAQSLRRSGFLVLTDVMDRSLKAQMKYADRLEADYVVMIGEEELTNNIVTLRDMRSSSQKEIHIDEIAAEIGKQEE